MIKLGASLDLESFSHFEKNKFLLLMKVNYIRDVIRVFNDMLLSIFRSS